jgi:alanyl-tRNA synthetase
LLRARLRHTDQRTGGAAEALKTTPQNLPGRVLSLVSGRRRLEQEVSKLRQQVASGAAAREASAKNVGGIRCMAREVEGARRTICAGPPMPCCGPGL